MSSLANPPIAFKTQFHDDFALKLAQRQSRFQSAVTDRGQISGDTFTINSLGDGEMDPVNNRYEDKSPSQLDHNTRIATMAAYDKLFVVDAFDIPRLAADPSYKFTGLLTDAANRRKDKTIYRALLDPVTQKTNNVGGTTTVALPASQIILAGGTAFTKNKLIQIRKMFRQVEGDEMNGEELYMAFNADILAQLLADDTLNTRDRLAAQMLQEGKLQDKWMGFTWLPYEALDNGAGGATERRTVAWAKSAVHFGTGINVKTEVGENKAKKGHPTEAYAWMTLGAGRQDELKVVACDFLV